MSNDWDRLWSEITSYKISTLLMAAVELRLFDYLERVSRIEELAVLLNVQPAPLTVFLESLTCIGYVEKKGDGYKNTAASKTFLVSSSSKFIGMIIHLEKYIYEHFLTPAQLIASLKNRDQQLSKGKLEDPMFRNYYQEVVYNKAINMKIARLVWRVLKHQEAPALAEIGRSPGKMLKTLQLLYPIGNFTYLPHWQELSVHLKQEFDMVIIQNTVHYLERSLLNNWLSELYQFVKYGGYVLVHDFFLDHLDAVGLKEMKQRLLLDWLTHGGIETLESQNLLTVANAIGFQEVTVQNEKNLGSLILLAKKG